MCFRFCVIILIVAVSTVRAGLTQDSPGDLSLEEIKHSLSSGDADSAEQFFHHANAAFSAGDPGKALLYYEALAQTGWQSDALFLNLGIAHFRNQSPGRAALWFRRAAHLNPGMPEVHQNLEYLRKQGGLIEFTEHRWQRTLVGIAPTTLRWTGWLFLWLGLFLLAQLTNRNKRSLSPLFAVTGGVVLLVSALLFSLRHYREKHLAPENFATVIMEGTSALTAPAPDSKPVITLPEGSEIKIIANTGPWIYASIPGNSVGWVHHTSVEPNWPVTVPDTGNLQVSAPSG